MFRAFLAHHQEILYCLVSRSLWQTVKQRSRTSSGQFYAILFKQKAKNSTYETSSSSCSVGSHKYRISTINLYSFIVRSVAKQQLTKSLCFGRILGAFAKLWKATLRFVMSVFPSVQPMEQLGSHWTNFREILSIFRKSVQKIQVSLQPDKSNGYFTGIILLRMRIV
jgi:hypothetical protein